MPTSGRSFWGFSVFSDWQALGRGWAIAWSPTPPHLSGAPEVVGMLEQQLDGSALLVTPTGPAIVADAGDPLAVLAVLAQLMPGRYDVTGDPPTIPETPAGAVA